MATMDRTRSATYVANDPEFRTAMEHVAAGYERALHALSDDHPERETLSARLFDARLLAADDPLAVLQAHAELRAGQHAEFRAAMTAVAKAFDEALRKLPPGHPEIPWLQNCRRDALEAGGLRSDHQPARLAS
jgi:hypothetical protein